MTTPLTHGVWNVVATPFHSDSLDVDLDSLARLVASYQEAGAAGLTVLGVFGEAASLSRAERRLVLNTVAATVNLPLVVGVTALSTRPAIDEVREAQDVVGDRIAGVMIQLNTAAPRTLAAHLSTIHGQTGAGIVAQNYPVSSGVSIGVDDEIDALGQTSGLVAIKAEAAPTALRISELVDRFATPVFGGLGGVGLIDELEAGAAGAMTGFSFPEGLIAAVNAHRTGGFEAARSAFAPYLPLSCFEQQPRIALAIRKACLVERGLIAADAVRPPAPSLPPMMRTLMKKHLAVLGAREAWQ